MSQSNLGSNINQTMSPPMNNLVNAISTMNPQPIAPSIPSTIAGNPLNNNLGLINSSSTVGGCSTPNIVTVTAANFMSGVNIQGMMSTAGTYVQTVPGTSYVSVPVGMSVATVIQPRHTIQQQGHGSTQRLTHVNLPVPASCTVSSAPNFFIQSSGLNPTPAPTPTPQSVPQPNTSCSLAKLQQLTNDIMELGPNHGIPCNTITPPPNLTPPPRVNMTPPPAIQRNITPPIPSLQPQITLPANHHFYKQFSRSRQVQRGSNITLNPGLMPNYQAINGFRMQQSQTATVLNTSYITNTGFMNPQIPSMQMSMVNMHPQPQYQEPAIQPNRPQNAMYAYGYINGGLPPHTLNGVMRR